MQDISSKQNSDDQDVVQNHYINTSSMLLSQQPTSDVPENTNGMMNIQSPTRIVVGHTAKQGSEMSGHVALGDSGSSPKNSGSKIRLL